MVRVDIEGVVQGVGFRPFVHRLAMRHGLAGWVGNTSRGVAIEAEGERAAVVTFLSGVAGEVPAHARIDRMETRWLAPAGFCGFTIRESAAAGDPTALILPDLAICAECVREIFDPGNRRYGHPFTNCTHCGPRFSIAEAVPYDRARTSMKGFPMCAACRAEYDDPADRRFHAQPNACPDCGPQLALWDATGARRETREAALRAAARAVRDGQIVAVKGLGGFHLMVAADQPDAVARLRRRKDRDAKPFAVMFPDLAAVRRWCEVSSLEEELLTSAQAPIVLLRRARAGDQTSEAPGRPAEGLAPGLPCLGVMLPYTALHHLLLRAIGGPVVATSGNRRDEPLCIDEGEAMTRLGGLVDQLLVHDRPIVRPVDDSLVRVVAGRELVLRRARGYAPLPVRLPPEEPVGDPSGRDVILAVGGHQKNTVALGIGSQVFLSQHVGDLETVAAMEAHARAIADVEALHRVTAAVLAADAHPGYASSRVADESGRPVVRVQHHVAHLLACLADNGLAPLALGVVWDGTGDGQDGTIWGGEFLVARGDGFERAGWLRTFPLPGGETAMREPRRAALGLLYELMGEEVWERPELPTLQAFTPVELTVLRGMLRRGVNAPRTSSVGRFFDAVASLAGLRQISRYEGQAAMELEFAAETAGPDRASGDARRADDLVWREAGGGLAGHVADWAPLVCGILERPPTGCAEAGGVGAVARRLHEALAACVVPAAIRVGLEPVALSGGCFQNRLLTELTIERLRAAGFCPSWHRRVPPNDGGLALGQVCAARRAGPLKSRS